jgi:aspartate kinase
VPEADLQKSAAIAEKVAKQFGCGGVSSSPKIDKISVQGIGMRSHSGVAQGLFRTLAEAGINVDLMSTSEVRVNVLVDGMVGQKALKSLQETFATK